MGKLEEYFESSVDLKAAQRRIGYQFKDIQHLKRAFTHASVCSFETEGLQLQDTFESLEWFGDSILYFLTSDIILKKIPNGTPHELTQHREQLISNTFLADTAVKMELEDFLVTISNHNVDDKKQRMKMRADMMEAIIGAIYQDSGMENARTFIENAFAEKISKLDHSHPYEQNSRTSPPQVPTKQGAKSIINNWAQAQRKVSVGYKLLELPRVAGVFKSQVSITGLESNVIPQDGEGNTKTVAERRAAEKLLPLLSITT
jgi:ribonuclease-3